MRHILALPEKALPWLTGDLGRPNAAPCMRSSSGAT